MTVNRALMLLAIGETIVWAGTYYLFPALLLRLEAAEGWSKTGLTAAFTAAVIVSGLIAPKMGRLIDRGHGPRLLAVSGLSAALLVAALPLAPNLLVFGLAWVLIGAAMGGCLYEPCFALVTRARGAEARRGITLISLIAGFAGTVSFPLNHVVSEAAGWQGATSFFALLMVGIGVPCLWFGARYLEQQRLPPPMPARPKDDKPQTTPWRRALQSPVFWGIASGFALMGLVHGVIISHILPIMQDRGVTSDTAVLAASMIGPMQVLGRLAMLAFERHVGSHAITTASFVAVSIAVVSLLSASVSPMLLVLFVVLHGSGYGVTSIMRPVVLRESMGDQDFGAISGLMALPYMLAVAIAPFFGSLLWEAGGYDLALEVMIATCLAGLAAHRFAAWQAGRM